MNLSLPFSFQFCTRLAAVFAVENQFKSKRQVVSEMGSDYESVLREIKQDEELAEDVGLDKPDESIS